MPQKNTNKGLKVIWIITGSHIILIYLLFNQVSLKTTHADLLTSRNSARLTALETARTFQLLLSGTQKKNADNYTKSPASAD